jgi:recombination DNA repair RAD52 pathway protein
MITDEQRAQLLRPINPVRVKSRDGLAYIEAYDVRAMLTRIFDFGGWSAELVDLHMLYEQPTETKGRNGQPGRPAFKVAYRATVRLSVPGAVYTEAAVGESLMPDFKRGDAHDMAVKTAESQALKRCAVNLGDQFGISLYNGGSMQPLIRRVILAADLPADKGLDEHLDELAAEDVRIEEEAEARAPLPMEPEKRTRVKATAKNQLPGMDERWTVPSTETERLAASVVELAAAFTAANITDAQARTKYAGDVVGRGVINLTELSLDEIDQVAASLRTWLTPAAGTG